jgi:23S rRNA A2030 N6-methylase RlmJ
LTACLLAKAVKTARCIHGLQRGLVLLDPPFEAAIRAG